MGPLDAWGNDISVGDNPREDGPVNLNSNRDSDLYNDDDVISGLGNPRGDGPGYWNRDMDSAPSDTRSAMSRDSGHCDEVPVDLAADLASEDDSIPCFPDRGNPVHVATGKLRPNNLHLSTQK